MPPRELAILWNSEKPGAKACADAVVEAARALGAGTRITEAHPVPRGFLDGVYACCVIGGDGTILGVVESAVAAGVPIFGINRGKLGYLASYSEEDLPHCIADIFDGKFRSVSHRLLECRFGNDDFDDPKNPPRLALNDVVIKAWENFKMTALSVYSSRCGFINTYHGDGLILTTSTGSTAYSLGAGGPLIHSEANVFALSPICPHTLTNRTLVLPPEMTIEIRNETPGAPVGVSVDGDTPVSGENAFPLRIRLSEKRLDIFQPPELSEFDILRKKLRWV